MQDSKKGTRCRCVSTSTVVCGSVRLHLLEAAKRSVLAYELQDGPLVEGTGDEQDDVVDHVAVGDVVEEGGLVTHVLELRHQLLAQLVVNHGHLVVEENFLYKLFLFSFNNN